MKKDCGYEPTANHKDNVKEQANTLLCLYQKMSSDKVKYLRYRLFRRLLPIANKSKGQLYNRTKKDIWIKSH
jgi:hypothetical protein